MYALVEIKGKQYRVEQDSVITVDHLEGEEGSEIAFDNVMLLNTGDAVNVGNAVREWRFRYGGDYRAQPWEKGGCVQTQTA